mmetsp:Transcript_50338/g.168175  ORF Transcript_50338/g.168175 Transcript_50338/m.168175 type:complete len:191 (-) Transcript_50338:76-648(-)
MHEQFSLPGYPDHRPPRTCETENAFPLRSLRRSTGGNSAHRLVWMLGPQNAASTAAGQCQSVLAGTTFSTAVTAVTTAPSANSAANVPSAIAAATVASAVAATAVAPSAIVAAVALVTAVTAVSTITSAAAATFRAAAIAAAGSRAGLHAGDEQFGNCLDFLLRRICRRGPTSALPPPLVTPAAIIAAAY